MRGKGPRSETTTGVGTRAGTGVGVGVGKVAVAGTGTRLVVLRRRVGEDPSVNPLLSEVVVLTEVETNTAPKSSTPGMQLSFRSEIDETGAETLRWNLQDSPWSNERPSKFKDRSTSAESNSCSTLANKVSRV